MTQTPEKAMVHVVGAGLAGLACATKLAEAGMPVTLYEAAPHAGGRCRSYPDPVLGRIIDNGNHLLLRANRQALSYIERLQSIRAFHPYGHYYTMIDLHSGHEWQTHPPFLPEGFALQDFCRFLRLMLARRYHRVSDIFPAHTTLFRQFIEPLCTAALNTHPDHASATMFRHLLWRLIRPGAAHYLRVRTTLGDALIDPALDYLSSKHASIHFSHRLSAIHTDDKRVTRLQFGRQQIALHAEDRVIFALPPEAVSTLLPLTVPEQFNPIVNGHFLYETAGSSVPSQLRGVIGSAVQWIFVGDGIISTTTSDAEHSPLRGLSQEAIAETLWRDTCRALRLGRHPLPKHRIITEKRATLAATPSTLHQRPPADTPYRNLRLAGDWLESPLPATIEAAIQSGHAAADWCLRPLKARLW